MAYFVAYFVFDPSVKFRFKTQSFVIDGIDGILFSRKMKKMGMEERNMACGKK